MFRRNDTIDDAPFDEILDLMDESIDASAAIDRWLNVFTRLLRLPDPQRQAIRTELDEHLRERVRDLLLSGHDEHQAVRCAIEELGKTAHLARRFEQANRPHRRRMLMHFTMLGLTAGAFAAGIVAFMPSSHRSTVALFEELKPQTSQAAEQARVAIDEKMDLAAIFAAIQTQTKLGLSIDWGALEQIGVLREMEPGISGKHLPLETLLELINQQVEGQSLAWRFSGNAILVNTAEHFDHKETVLASYDIESILDSIAAKYAPGFAGQPNTHAPYRQAMEDVTELILNLVESEKWRENGGDLAQLRVVGGKMFVQAPPRMQKGVAWMLEQLADGVVAEKIPPQGQVSRAMGPFPGHVPFIDHISSVTVCPGDTLAKIASEYYGDVAEWKAIYDANRTVIGSDPSGLKPGMKLSMPQRAKPASVDTPQDSAPG